MTRGRLWAAASSIAIATPVAAQPAPAQVPASVSIPAPVALSPIDAFYARRNEAPLWLADAASRAAAEKLAAVLREASLDGLPEGPERAASVEAAIARGQPSDDKLISSAWVRYVQALKAPVRGVSFGDPALAPKVPSAETILGDAARAPSLAAHVDQVAAVNPFYSALRAEAEKQGAAADPHVLATLDRLRLIPASGRAILVDLASAQLWMVEDGRVADTMKVVVGMTKSPTPLLAGTVHYVTFNPYWHIPDDVARRKVAPVVLRRGVAYLKAARYETWSGFGAAAERIDPESVDWKAVADGTADVHLRQLPGANNMMGAMKFGFENDFDIFLHDTPHRELFAKARRTFSMGCIRLEHADRLAQWLLGRDAAPQGDDPEQHVQLTQGVPVYVTYLTANVDDGQLAFADDVYKLDPAPTAPLATASASAARGAEPSQSQ